MKSTLAIVGAPAVAALVLLGGTPAHAAENPRHDHATKAERKHDRKIERRQERRADRATPKPAQDTTTTAHPTSPPRVAPRHLRGAVSCAVTADRAGSSFMVQNGCDTTETVTVSIQAQPGPWHVGLCAAGGCHLISRYDVQVAPGAHMLAVPATSACFYQVDLKWHGRLIRSNHYTVDCTPTKPKPPLPKPRAHPPVIGHHQPHARVRLTATPTSSSMAPLPRTGGAALLVGYSGFGLLVVGGSLVLLTRQPRRTTRAWKKAQR